MIITSLQLAQSSLRAAKLILDTFPYEDNYASIAAQLLQHSLEVSIKYFLTYSNIQYPHTISIAYLVVLAEANNCDLMLPAYLAANSEIITKWENIMYVDNNHTISYNSVKTVSLLVENYINKLPKK